MTRRGHPLELVGAWADITERKQAEQAALEANVELQETKRYLTRLIESSTDAIISTDKEGNVVLFNEGAETLLGYRAEEVIGRRVRCSTAARSGANEVAARDAQARRHRFGLRERASGEGRQQHSRPDLGFRSLRRGGPGDRDGRLCHRPAERKRAEEELQKAHDELEKRVEERTTELKAARERLQYLMTVTPGDHVHQSGSGDYTCTFVSENVDPIMGFSAWEMLEDPGVLAVAPASRGCPARLRRDGPSGRKRRRDDRVPLPAPGRDTISGSRTRSRSSMTSRARRSRSSAPGRISPTASRRSRRSASAWPLMNDLQDARRRQPRRHLHHASLGRFCLHVRQRESEIDHGLCAVGDAR